MLNREITEEINSDVLNKKFASSLKKLSQLIEIFPDHIKLMNMKSNVLIISKKYDEAIDFCQDCIKRKFFSTSIYNNLAIAIKNTYDYKSAIHYFKKSLSLEKNHITYFNLGNLYTEIYNYDESLKNYMMAINVNQRFTPSYINASRILVKKNNYVEALKLLNRARKLNIDRILIFENLGRFFLKVRKFFYAEIYFKKMLILDPAQSEYLQAVLRGYCCDGQFKRYKKLTAFYFKNREEKPSFNFPKLLKKKFNIGLISADIRQHPIGYFLKDFVPEITKKLSINIYSTVFYKDHISQLISDYTNWKLVGNKSNEELAHQIFKDKNDILIDLSGFAPRNRIELFKLKPCKIQASWAGWLASTRLKEMDYIIGDRIATPHRDQRNFTEKIYNLPNSWCVYSESELNKNLIKQPQKKDYVVFGCFQRPEKLNSPLLNAWSQIIRSCSKSYLQFNNKFYSDNEEEIIKNFFSNRGIEKSRIIFNRCKNRKAYLESFNEVDIYLDTFPYNGGTTSFEASFFNIPILTLKNESHMFRCGESINSLLKNDDWIAYDIKDYIFKAKKFCNNKKLYLYKKALNKNPNKKKLFDSKQFSKDFLKMLEDIN
ncbi:MAG: hypothetical protein CMP25_03345 [Rickettsiales bacterium]|nr:hypothetical protein [Rickettsiales bacterium]